MGIRISILVPTRKRPRNIVRLANSIVRTASKPSEIELIAYVDDDDDSYNDIEIPLNNYQFLSGPRITISEAWNECWRQASGELLGLCADDIVFTTPNWDYELRKIFSVYEDKIAYVFGDDGSVNGKHFGTHGFIHQNWSLVVGYFVPPYFSANQVDRWLNECARRLGRLRYGRFGMEHLHPAYKKADMDEVYEEGRQRNPHNEEEWNRRQTELEADVQKLREFIDG